jgi:hypothetical protein
MERDMTIFSDTGTFTAGSIMIEPRDIAHHWSALSHNPERRALAELTALAARIAAFGGVLDRIIAEGGAIDKAAELTEFTARHTAITRAYWASESRCASAFIVGPSKFPTRQQEKRHAVARARAEKVTEHLRAARAAVHRKAWPHGAPGEPIRQSNPEAIDELRAQLANEHARRDKIKARDHGGWELSNARARIKRLEGRIAELEANKARGLQVTDHDTTEGRVTMEDDPDAGRLRLVFKGKPSDATRAKLKGNGFKWAPSAGAWQRILTDNARREAQQFLQSIAHAHGVDQ